MKRTEKSAPRGREEWRSLVQSWKASGATAKAFAASNGLSTASLFCWSSIFKREEPPRLSGRLLPVRVSSVDTKRAELELRLGVMRVRFEDGTSPRYVAELARALLDVASA